MWGEGQDTENDGTQSNKNTQKNRATLIEKKAQASSVSFASFSARHIYRLKTKREFSGCGSLGKPLGYLHRQLQSTSLVSCILEREPATWPSICYLLTLSLDSREWSWVNVGIGDGVVDLVTSFSSFILLLSFAQGSVCRHCHE